MNYRYFAFLDLLGYKDLINEDLKTGKNKLKKRLIEAFSSLKDINESDVSIQAISDSIFLTFNSESLGFNYFANIIRTLQLAFLDNGLLLRGGISFNQHFQNGKVTYSPALVDAYDLETKYAFYPRIILHESVISKLQNENKLDEALSKNILTIHANTYQIHFLDDKNWQKVFENISTIAKQNLSSIENDPRIYAKHWYLQDYLIKFRPQGIRYKRYLPTWNTTP